MKYQLFYFFVFIFILSSCSKSVESETKSWDRNVKIVKDLKVEYPNFEKILDSQLLEAQREYDKVASITGEEEKIVQLEKANKILNAEFVRNLRTVQREQKDLKEQLQKLEAMKLPDNLKDSKRRAIRDTEAALREAKSIANKSIADLTGATSVSRKVSRQLEDAEKAIKKVISESDKIAAEEKKAKQKAEEAKQEKEKQQYVVCSYCDTKNESKNGNCKSCGAALPKK
ncbi:MAG: hypothetical protein AAF740_08710 [Bacteroidota bacterium]